MMWWGYSPALNLLDEYLKDYYKSKDNVEDHTNTCNILLLGQLDNRHILKTIAEKYRYKQSINLNFYLYEPLLENVARELLFTIIALEPPEQIGIAEKTLFFLELFGNTLIRPTTSKYLVKISKRLLNVITDVDYAKKILPSVSLDYLKYKEKDHLEIIFKYWGTSNKSYDILSGWDERLRKHLGVRYDSRSGIYDWDYHMRYHSNGADVLRLHEYKKFREKGISFHFEDTNPCIPNCTLESAIFSSGSKISSHGYLGDIITGPYVTFGFDCEDEDMHKKINGQICKSATDFTERNIMKIFHEIKHKSPFVPQVECNESLVLLQDTLSELKICTDFSNESKSDQRKSKSTTDLYESLGTNNCRIIFTPTALKDFIHKLEFQNFFDLIFISQTLVLRYTNQEIFKIFKPQSKIIVETPKFILNYRREDLEKFKTDLENLMKECHCTLIEPYDYEKDNFALFKVE